MKIITIYACKNTRKIVRLKLKTLSYMIRYHIISKNSILFMTYTMWLTLYNIRKITVIRILEYVYMMIIIVCIRFIHGAKQE